MDESPEQLLEYFMPLQREHPECEEWRSGAALTQKWITLMANQSVSQKEFTHLMGLVELPSKPPGSGWFDLWIRIRYWGYESGFQVPDAHPWEVDSSRIQCEDDSGFEGQITSGKEYRILDSRESEGLLRVSNDEEKQRWCPPDHFRILVMPERNWITKGES
ncbi:MAG: hypothetical protein ACKVJU_23030 [Verrucomicrobiales bacterium]